MSFRQRQEDDDIEYAYNLDQEKRKRKNDERAPDDEVDLATLVAEDHAPHDRPSGPIMSRDELNERLAAGRARQAAHQQATSSSRAFAQVSTAFAMMVMGVIFMSMFLPMVFGFGNWWAFFIVGPGVFTLFRAVMDRQSHGRFSAAGRKLLVGALFTLLVGVMALFNAWNLWPLFLVLSGILAVAGYRDE